MRRSLDSDFRRFRERGDVPALERVFDGTAPELLRIARHLAPDATSADDLVQATWVVALENCARWDSARPLLPWLIGVLAREAARARRDAARRVDPERLDSRVVVEPGQGLESDELRDAVRSALADLPEQERRVLEPHLLEGRRAFELAEDLGCAPGTVRVRISRGLARLRRALPSGLASGAALVALEGRGEAFVRRAVLQRGESVELETRIGDGESADVRRFVLRAVD